MRRGCVCPLIRQRSECCACLADKPACRACRPPSNRLRQAQQWPSLAVACQSRPPIASHFRPSHSLRGAMLPSAIGGSAHRYSPLRTRLSSSLFAPSSVQHIRGPINGPFCFSPSHRVCATGADARALPFQPTRDTTDECALSPSPHRTVLDAVASTRQPAH